MESRLVKLKQMNDEFVSKKVHRDVETNEFESIEVKRLIVNTDLTTNRITFGASNNSLQFHKLRIQNLTLSGMLNGNGILPLFTNTLRSSGFQVFNTNTSTIKIRNVTANRIATISGLVSGKTLSDLVRIDSGNFIIDRFVKFTKPLVVGDLEVHGRVNHINVENGQLDVLLQNSDQVQEITGFKVFEDVELKEPVIIRVSGCDLV